MDRTRRQQAFDLRIAAAQVASRHSDIEIAASLCIPADEARYRARNYLASFTKGLPHDRNSGLLRDASDYDALLAAIKDGNVAGLPPTPSAFQNNPQWHADNTLRAASTQQIHRRPWEDLQAGSDFYLLGPDAQALTVAPPPTLGSARSTAEMAELYAMALLRDVPLRAFGTHVDATSADRDMQQQRLRDVRASLARLSDIDERASTTESSDLQRALQRQSLLHGNAPHDESCLSQFLLCGTTDFSDDNDGRGIIAFGDCRIDQRIRQVIRKDYATTWNEWLDLQHGADLRFLERASQLRGRDCRRFIVTPRDLAARVRHTAPQQLFFNACLMLPQQIIDSASSPRLRALQELHSDEFAGHRLTALLAQATSCAITAARFQQFHVHRRLRPEALAARLEKYDHPDVTTPALSTMFADLVSARLFDDNGKLPARANRLLPLAWIEGSPMAPSYCSAYAAATGACATIIKTVFDGNQRLDLGGLGGGMVLIPSDDGLQLLPQTVSQAPTLASEIDKLAANLVIGRCWAGVSFYSDVAAGLDLGERVASCLLEEMQLLRAT